jgi:predicted NUDIX family NTP pyrophosphohydrolase
VSAWAVVGDLDVTTVESNSFEMEWPPRSGRTAEFPEVDRAGWFDPDTARKKLVRGQGPFIDLLIAALSDPSPA